MAFKNLVDGAVSQLGAAVPGAAASPQAGASADAPAVEDDGGSAIEDSVYDTSDHSEQEPESTPEVKPEEEAKPVEKKPEPPSEQKEKIWVTDTKGRRQVEIDYGDKAKIRKAFELAAGMQLFRNQRDEANRKLESLTPYQQRFEKLEQAWAQGKEDGIIRLLSGNKSSLDAVVQQRIQAIRERENMDPMELARVQRQEAESAKDAELARLRQEMEDFKAGVTNEKTEAEKLTITSHLETAMDRYSFDESVGSASDAEGLNRMLWAGTMAALKEHQDAGVNITKDVIAREFKAQRALLGKMTKQAAEKDILAAQARSKVSAGIKATELAAAKMSGGSPANQKANDALRKGDIRGVFAALRGKRS